MALGSAAQSQTPFPCDETAYIATSLSTSPSTTISRLVVQGSSYTLAQVYSGSLELGAFGYNMQDNYIYSVKRGSDNYALYRFGSNFVPQRLGTISGLPAGGTAATGDFANDGRFYVFIGGLSNVDTSTIYRINIQTLTATPVTLSRPVQIGTDIAWHDGLLYGSEQDANGYGWTFSINPATGAVTRLRFNGIWTIAMWGGLNGVFGMALAQYVPPPAPPTSNPMYAFDPATGVASYEAAGTLGTQVTNYEGTKCQLSDNPWPKVVRIRYAKTTLPGNVNQNFTINATNGLPQTVINATTGFSAYQKLTNPAENTTFTEQAVAGWRGARLRCVADTGRDGVVQGSVVYDNQTPSAAGSTFTSVVPANTFVKDNDYTCTFTNDRTQVRFVKVTAPANFNLNFTLTGTNGIGTLTINAAGPPSAYRPLTNVGAITTITEAAMVNWRGMSLTCVADTAVNGEVIGRTYLISNVTGGFNSDYVATIAANRLLAGNNYTCTMSNEHCVRVRYVKVTLPENINQNFTINPTNGLPQTVINATTGFSPYQNLSNPAVNTVFVELAVVGWRGRSMDCVADTGRGSEVPGREVFNNSTPGTVGTSYSSTVPANTFIPGNDYTCTFTNEAARIRYAKVTLPPNFNQNFTLTGTNGVGTLTINATTGFSAYVVLSNTAAATVLTEAAVADWQPLKLECIATTGNNGVTPNAMVFPAAPTPPGTAGQPYSWTVPANTFVYGNNYTCTATNARTRVRVGKVTEGGIGRFTFNGSPANANGFPTDDSYTVVTTAPKTLQFGPFRALSKADTLTEIVETVPLAWTLASVACSDLNAGQTGNPILPIIGYITDGRTLIIPAANVKPGADLSCVFADTLTGLTVSGQVILDNGASGGTAYDGAQNGGERGLPGVLLRLTDCGSHTYGSDVSDGAGNFALNLTGVPADSEVCLYRDPLTGHAGVSQRPGTTTNPVLSPPTYDMLRFRVAANTNYTGVTFGMIALPSLLEDTDEVVLPGQAVLIKHKYWATTVSEVNFALANIIGTPDASLFDPTLHFDPNCDGTLGGPPPADYAVTAGVSVCVIVRVFAKDAAPAGAELRYDLTATTTLVGNTLATLDPAVNHDTVKVSSSGKLALTKRVRNITADGPNAPWLETSNGSPGDILQYQVIFTNPAGAVVTDVKVEDATPSFTSLSPPVSVFRSPSGAPCQVDAPPSGGTPGYKGRIAWSCNGPVQPYDQGEFRFSVKIEE
uniref:SpaA-like prealbumin fold domain-containing protein n=2 Tax=Phyllobacteriaceae TaxID=69277 RepID=Q11I62_CHESB